MVRRAEKNEEKEEKSAKSIEWFLARSLCVCTFPGALVAIAMERSGREKSAEMLKYVWNIKRTKKFI